MGSTDSFIAVCNSLGDVWEIIELMEQRDISLAGLSIVGLSPDPGDHVVGLYRCEGSIRTLGFSSCDIWSHVLDVGLFVLPGTGPVVVGGPLVQALVFTLKTVRETHKTGGISLIGFALKRLGVQGELVGRFDTAIRAGEVILLYRAVPDEVERMRTLLSPRPTVYFERNA